MRYQELKEKLKDFVIFSLMDIRKIEPAFYRPRLNEWQEKGYIKKLRRGYYMFSDLPLNEKVLFLIANKLYTPSYVSFETALSYYGLIPEGVYSITSASSKKTTHFKTPIVEFSYRRVKQDHFFGYKLEEQMRQQYKIAEMEKAVLDYLYAHPEIVKDADFYEWRFNSQEFLAKADMVKFHAYADAFRSKIFSKRVERLIILIHNSK